MTQRCWFHSLWITLLSVMTQTCECQFYFHCGLKPCTCSWWHRDVSVSFTFTVEWNPVPVLDDTEMSVSFFLCGLHYSPWRHAEMSVSISFFCCGLKPCNPVSLHSDTVVPVKVLLFTMDWNCVISRTHHDDPELSSFTSSLSLIHGWKSQLVFILKSAYLRHGISRSSVFRAW